MLDESKELYKKLIVQILSVYTNAIKYINFKTD